jgi:hypothetical protein
MEKEDKFGELFVEEGDINESLVRDILVDYIRLTKEGGIIPLEEFNELKNDNKILIILLARRVLALRGISSDIVSPKEVQDASGLPKGTVNPTLKSLEAKRFVTNHKGKYKIPNHAITKLKSLIRDGKAN